MTFGPATCHKPDGSGLHCLMTLGRFVCPPSSSLLLLLDNPFVDPLFTYAIYLVSQQPSLLLSGCLSLMKLRADHLLSDFRQLKQPTANKPQPERLDLSHL